MEKSSKFPSNTVSRNYNFHEVDFHGIYRAICSADWRVIYFIHSILDDICNHYASVYHGHEAFRSNYPAWYTKEIIKNIKLKSKYSNKCKKYGSPNGLQNLKNMRVLVKSQIQKVYKHYTVNVKFSQSTFKNSIVNAFCQHFARVIRVLSSSAMVRFTLIPICSIHKFLPSLRTR